MSLRSPRKQSTILVAVFATVLGSLVLPTASSAAPATQTRVIHKGGTAAYQSRPVGSGTPARPISTELPDEVGPEANEGAAAGAAATTRTQATGAASVAHRSLGARDRARAAAGPRINVPGAATPARPNDIVRNGPRLLQSFDGINHRDQRLANNGNQFTLEPPDQGLCVGDGHVVEGVNDAFRVYGTDGTPQTGTVDLNTFYGYPPAINRTTGIAGPELTDPTCLYDPTTRTFFFVVLTLDRDEVTNELSGGNHLDIAVTKNPLGAWNIYSLDVTDDGSNGTPVHPFCPCIGDYPHIGVDANGFYITTNEYSFFGTEYNSAQVYAFSKRALARGDADVLVTQIDTTAADQGRNGFTVWPAQSPTADQYSSEAGGTEYFLSSNAAEEATGTKDYVSNSIVAWSLTNTRSLDSDHPNVRLNNTRVGVQTYSLPPPANQKPGPIPLGECLSDTACATFLLGAPDQFAPETEAALDSNDTRMQQVTYANGRLYGALDTAVTVAGEQKAGIGWYIVRPETTRNRISAQLTRQGQLGLARNNLTYPAIGINAAGQGVMAFTLVGRDYYPSAAYSAFDGRTGAGAIFLAKAGLGPEDGFSGYKAFNNPPRPRWGDYGATAVDGATIWIASEYIGQTCTLDQYEATPFGSCGGTRTALANWYTRISQVRP
jgi:hypothetical protein